MPEAAAATGQFQADLEVRLVGVVGGEDDARARREIPQHLQVTRFEMEPVAPGQIESEESLDSPDHPSPRLGRSEGRVLRHGFPPHLRLRQARRPRWTSLTLPPRLLVAPPDVHHPLPTNKLRTQSRPT